MHGRVKVKTTAEKAEEKRIEREAKAKLFRDGTAAASKMREAGVTGDDALQVTGRLLAANPDVYTLWNYRREILLARRDQGIVQPADGGDGDTDENVVSEFQKLCINELQLTAACLVKNPKSYCAWHQRGWIVNIAPQPNLKKEIELCNQFLDMDERNFHGWDYRRFVSKRADVPALEELDYTLTKIKQNFSNFSSWYYRSTLFTEACSKNLLNFEDIWSKEYELVENAVFTDPSDQSAWFYHRWLSSINFGRELAMNAKPLKQPLLISSVLMDMKNNKLFLVLQRAVKQLKTDEAFDICNSMTKQSIIGDFSPITSGLCDKWSMVLPESIRSSGLSIMKQNEVIPLDFSDKSCEVILLVRQQSAAPNKYLLKGANIETLKCLQDMESDNKWVNSALSLVESSDQLKTVDKLVKLDPLRKNYYADQRSRLTLQKMRGDVGATLDLRKMSLSCLYYADHFAHTRFIDLSFNFVTFLGRNFNSLLCLEYLVLDNNQVSAIEKGINVVSLKAVSLKHNNLSTVRSLSNLATCRHLEVVMIHGNPIVGTQALGQEELGFAIISTECENLKPEKQYRSCKVISGL